MTPREKRIGVLKFDEDAAVQVHWDLNMVLLR